MGTPATLRPLDVAVALLLVEQPGAQFLAIAGTLGVSASTAHGAVARLAAAGLVRPEERRVNRRALLEFLEHGVRYAFPATPGRTVRGVPTAHAGPDLAGEIVTDEPVVWPDPDGPSVGPAVAPLLPRAAQLAETSPGLYAMLALVDALRVGRARERSLAMEHLRRRLDAAA